MDTKLQKLVLQGQRTPLYYTLLEWQRVAPASYLVGGFVARLVAATTGCVSGPADYQTPGAQNVLLDLDFVMADEPDFRPEFREAFMTGHWQEQANGLRHWESHLRQGAPVPRDPIWPVDIYNYPRVKIWSPAWWAPHRSWLVDVGTNLGVIHLQCASPEDCLVVALRRCVDQVRAGESVSARVRRTAQSLWQARHALLWDLAREYWDERHAGFVGVDLESAYRLIA